MTFLGIDFGWENKASGVAALDWNGSSLHLTSLELLHDPAGVLEWVEAHAAPDAVVGIDAPIVIPNATGMRPADKLAHVKYGKYHAGAYPASRARTYWVRALLRPCLGTSSAPRRRAVLRQTLLAPAS